MTTIFPSDLRSIARALSGDVAGRQVLAPGPGHSPKDRSLSVTLSPTAPEGFLAFSHAGDDFMACRDYVKAKLGIANDNWRRAEARLVQVAQVEGGRGNESGDSRHIGIAKSIVDGLVCLRGSPGEAYLGNTRQIEVTAIVDVLERTDSIGWHPAVLFRQEGHPLSGKRLGCIVAIMTDADMGKPTGGISRTYIHEGQKVAKAKGLGPAGVVRLSLDEDVLGGLHVAEGIETALAAMSIGLRPTWSTGSTAIMAKFPVVAGIEALSILADNDPNGAGERAARELQTRWQSAGREARVWKPKTRGDLNDILMGAAQ